MDVVVAGAEIVRRHLDFPSCIGVVRAAMISLSRRETRQLPREILRLDNGMLGVMPGAMGGAAEFGIKVVSVYPGNFAKDLPSHQGAILLFESEAGALRAIVHAGEVTRIRTACASAAATDALARADARVLGVLGYGEQAEAHVEAIRHVRPIDRVLVWGRDAARRAAFAGHVRAGGLACEPVESPAAVAAGADILCTTTGAAEPILFGADVRPGTHLNIVGSSFAGPAEIDNALVASARFYADSRDSVLTQGAEFLRAREAGLIDDSHIVAEIGEVYDGRAPGRGGAEEITIYKSLGHVVQDLASAWHVCQAAGTARVRF